MAEAHLIALIAQLRRELTRHAGDPEAHWAQGGRTDNPHAVTAEQAGADPAGTAAALIASHEAGIDPHPQYMLAAEKGAANGVATLGDDGRIPKAQQSAAVQEGIAAAGSTAGTAAAITGDWAEVTSSTAGSADGVRLPDIAQGEKTVVFNKTANALKVYPPTGKQVNWAGVDVPHSLPAWNTITYYAAKTDSYYT